MSGLLSAALCRGPELGSPAPGCSRTLQEPRQTGVSVGADIQDVRPAGLGTSQHCLQGHRLWGGEARRSAEEVAPNLSLVQQVPLLPEAAYGLSASSRSPWREEGNKEGFRKNTTGRQPGFLIQTSPCRGSVNPLFVDINCGVPQSLP